MDKIYRLELMTLIKSLQQQSATLKAELEPGTVPGVFEDCTAHVRIRQGEIIKCSIVGKSGPQVSGLGALQYLRNVDRWLVSLTPEKAEPPTTTPSLQTTFTPVPPQSSPTWNSQQSSPNWNSQQSSPNWNSPQSSPNWNSQQSSPNWNSQQSSPTWNSQQFQAPSREQMLSPQIIIPRQRGPIPPGTLDRLPHRERMVYRIVFAMVNGSRTLQQIKEQLMLSEETVDRVLNDLYAMQIIEW